MKGLFRDATLVAIGLNLGMICTAVAVGSKDLALLCGANILLCGIGLSVKGWMENEDENED